MRKEKWTTDLREIERRLINKGLISNALIWDAKDLKKNTDNKAKPKSK